MNSVRIFDYISKVSLYLLVVLLPLWFLPFTQNVLEYQKQALLVVLAFGGVVAWLAKMVYEGEARFRFTPLHWGVLMVLFAVGVSTLFSAWRYGSFWGWPLDVTDNFLTVLAFALLYVVISQSVSSARHLFSLLVGLVLAGTVAVLFALLQAKEIFFLPFSFASDPTFNTIGTPNSVAVFAAILLPLALALASSPLTRQKAWKGVFRVVAFLLFVGLVLLDFFTAWLVAMAGLLVLLVFELWSARGQGGPGRISLPMLFLLIALFFVIVGDFSVPGAPHTMPEVSPSWRDSLAVLRGVVPESPVDTVLGTGPGTFVFDYPKHRLPELNQTIFWSTRFQSATAEILDWAITKGALGIIALATLIGFAVFVLWRSIMEREGKPLHGALAVGLSASLGGIATSMFLYPATFTVWFVFWVLLGGAGLVAGKRVQTSLVSGSAIGFAASFGLMLVVVFGLGLALTGGQKYYAQMNYLRGVQAQNEGDRETAISKIQHAADRNPSVDLYWRSLAHLYLDRANEVANDQSLSEEVRQRQAGVAVNSAIEAAQRATTVASANVANWNVRGFLYRNLIGVAGAEKFAIESYERARELEPSSPFPWTELGRVKILSGELQEAVADLQKAIDLKPDYAPAHYLLAVAYEQQGNSQEAITKLQEAKLVVPNDVGLAFQLGVLYYRQNELGKARDEFERAKAVNSRYSNARYMLGLVQDRLGRKADALAEFAAVAALNPDNQEVKSILGNLAAGRAALDGIGQPSTPPIQENPEEIAPEEQ